MSSVQPCPEPIAYSSDMSNMADFDSTSPFALALSPSYSGDTVAPIDFVVSKPEVFNNLPDFAPVDSILANSVGPVTNPVTNQSVAGNPERQAVLATMDQSNAEPVMSSSMGADINSSYTLTQNMKNNDFATLDQVLAKAVVPSQPAQPQIPKPQIPQPLKPLPPQQSQPLLPQPLAPQLLTPSQPVEPSKPVVTAASLTPSESFKNINNAKPTENKPNLAKYINKQNKQKVEHFNNKRTVEHYFTNSSMVDNVILIVVLCAAGYILFQTDEKVTEMVSKIPVISHLVDPKTSDNNKLMIVGAIVIGVILIMRVLSPSH